MRELGYRWGFDFAVTSGGNRYVLVMIDHFAKWVESVALPNKTGASTARALLEGIPAVLGASAEILTYQGTKFRGEFQKKLTRHGMDWRLQSREHRHSDGLVERMVQTMKRSLRKSSVENAVKGWDFFFPYVAMGYRMAQQR